MPEEQKKAPEMNEEQKDLANFEGEISKAKDASSAEKIVKEKLDGGKANVVAKSFDKVAGKVKDKERLKTLVNSIEEKWCLKEMAGTLKNVKNAEVVKHVIEKVSKSSDRNCVEQFANNMDSWTMNRLEPNTAKAFINKIEEGWFLNSMANCIRNIANVEVVKHAFEKVNKTSDRNCVEQFSRNVDGNTLNKLEPNNAKWFINKVEEAWSLKNMATKINSVKDKDVVSYTVKKVTEKWDQYCLKEFSKNLGPNVINSMNTKDIHAFARKSLMKWGAECASAMEWNKTLMNKLDAWTKSLITEYANQADNNLSKQLDNI